MLGDLDRTGAGHDEPGDVAVLAQRDHTLVILHGDIDLRCADDLEHAGRFSIDAGRRTVMDVRNLRMIDSVGLSFVIRLAAGLQAAGADLVVRGRSRRLAELLTVLGADGLVRWDTQEDNADGGARPGPSSADGTV